MNMPISLYYKTYRSLGKEQVTSKNQKEQHTKLVKTSGPHNRKLACFAMSPRCAWVHYTHQYFKVAMGTHCGQGLPAVNTCSPYHSRVHPYYTYYYIYT